MIIDELKYLYERYSEREISRVLEIPRGSLYNYIREIYKMPDTRQSVIHNFYRREVYSQLRSYGVPTNVAESRRNISPESFKRQIQSLENLIIDIAQKNVEKQRLKDLENGVTRDYAKLAKVMENSIRHSLQNKKVSPEQWEKYLDDLRRKIYG